MKKNNPIIFRDILHVLAVSALFSTRRTKITVDPLPLILIIGTKPPEWVEKKHFLLLIVCPYLEMIATNLLLRGAVPCLVNSNSQDQA
jgi:hypothetical protein